MSIETAIEIWVEDNIDSLIEYFAEESGISEDMWDWVEANAQEKEYGRKYLEEREKLMCEYITNKGLYDELEDFINDYTWEKRDEIYQDYLENEYWEVGDAKYCASKEDW